MSRLSDGIEELEEKKVYADLIVSLEPTYIFRPPDMIKNMILLLLERGYYSVVPIIKDYNQAWLEKEDEKKRVDSGNIPRHLKKPPLISVKGIGYVTHPEFLRDGRIFGDNCGLLEVDRHYAKFEIRHQKDIEILNNITNLLVSK